jgi:hypothetical protein
MFRDGDKGYAPGGIFVEAAYSAKVGGVGFEEVSRCVEVV